MKIIVTLCGLVIFGLGIMYIFPSTQSYVAESITETVVEVKTVDLLETKIKEAKDAALASTTAKAQAAYDKVMEAEMKRVTDEVKADYIAEIEKTISDPGY